MKFYKKTKDHLGRTIIVCHSFCGLKQYKFVSVQIGGQNFWRWFEVPKKVTKDSKMEKVPDHLAYQLDQWMRNSK
ncbi:MAG: hypothetical protein M0Q12_10950 [Synergistaceae bacterium]|jgi:hypothetical protein|nr:hypothetical protein [Synergistaceae bacterium]